MDFNYKELLKKAKSETKELAKGNERFEIPKVHGHIQGNKTIVSNFLQIAKTINRDPNHLLKYIQKNLATPGEIKDKVVIFGTKLSSEALNKMIEKYVKEFVICPECHKPDTQIVKEQGFYFLKCMVCGAKRPIKYKI